MREILDHDYINEFAELSFGDNGSGFLEVNQPAWQDELYRLERRRNAGCILVLVGLVLSMFLPIPGRGYILLIGFIIAFQKRNTDARKFSNLLAHGKYNYEVYNDKIVRYTDVGYLRFEFDDIKKARIRKFGVVLFKHVDINSYLLHHEKKGLLVIPNKIEGYNQIVEHLIKEGVIKKRKTN